MLDQLQSQKSSVKQLPLQSQMSLLRCGVMDTMRLLKRGDSQSLTTRRVRSEKKKSHILLFFLLLVRYNNLVETSSSTNLLSRRKKEQNALLHLHH